MNRDILNKCIEIACSAHARQVDKSGLSYILHPLYVMGQVKTERAKCIAVMHDVIEDNPDYDDEILTMNGIPKDIANSVLVLTRDFNVRYFDYIDSIKESRDLDIIAVKIEDLKHNMDITRLKVVTNKDLNRLQKYHKALVILED